MPTVTLPNGKKRTFAYNAVGKAQASYYANMNGGKVKMNPNYGDELSTETGPKSKAPKKIDKVEKKQIIDFDTTDKDKKPKGPSAAMQKAKMVGELGKLATVAVGAIGAGIGKGKGK